MDKIIGENGIELDRDMVRAIVAQAMNKPYAPDNSLPGVLSDINFDDLPEGAFAGYEGEFFPEAPENLLEQWEGVFEYHKENATAVMGCSEEDHIYLKDVSSENDILWQDNGITTLKNILRAPDEILSRMDASIFMVLEGYERYTCRVVDKKLRDSGVGEGLIEDIRKTLNGHMLPNQDKGNRLFRELARYKIRQSDKTMIRLSGEDTKKWPLIIRL